MAVPVLYVDMLVTKLDNFVGLVLQIINAANKYTTKKLSRELGLLYFDCSDCIDED